MFIASEMTVCTSEPSNTQVRSQALLNRGLRQAVRAPLLSTVLRKPLVPAVWHRGPGLLTAELITVLGSSQEPALSSEVGTKSSCRELSSCSHLRKPRSVPFLLPSGPRVCFLLRKPRGCTESPQILTGSQILTFSRCPSS